jgi:hypothetical protein
MTGNTKYPDVNTIEMSAEIASQVFDKLKKDGKSEGSMILSVGDLLGAIEEELLDAAGVDTHDGGTHYAMLTIDNAPALIAGPEEALKRVIDEHENRSRRDQASAPEKSADGPAADEANSLAADSETGADPLAGPTPTAMPTKGDANPSIVQESSLGALLSAPGRLAAKTGSLISQATRRTGTAEDRANTAARSAGATARHHAQMLNAGLEEVQSGLAAKGYYDTDDKVKRESIKSDFLKSQAGADALEHIQRHERMLLKAGETFGKRLGSKSLTETSGLESFKQDIDSARRNAEISPLAEQMRLKAIQKMAADIGRKIAEAISRVFAKVTAKSVDAPEPNAP